LCHDGRGIQFPASGEDIEIYPNPTNDVIFIQYAFNYPANFVITNIYGKKVLAGRIDQTHEKSRLKTLVKEYI
jgi:hypothetical protein